MVKVSKQLKAKAIKAAAKRTHKPKKAKGADTVDSKYIAFMRAELPRLADVLGFVKKSDETKSKKSKCTWQEVFISCVQAYSMHESGRGK